MATRRQARRPGRIPATPPPSKPSPWWAKAIAGLVLVTLVLVVLAIAATALRVVF